jgi:hypothetical protein
LSSDAQKLWWRTFGRKSKVLATTAFPLAARSESQVSSVYERHLSQIVIPTAARHLHIAANCGSFSFGSDRGDEIWRTEN